MGYLPKLVKNKRLGIDKANATMLLVVAMTSFIVAFSLVASKSLISQSRYQSRVIAEKQKALKQLNENNKNITSLVASYKSFVEQPQNILSGNPAGNGPIDGDNSKIILDALPSKYDFPGLISSIEKVLKDGGYQLASIGGLDDEIAQQNTATETPQPVAIPFPLSVKSKDEASSQKLLTILERSIRPMYVDRLSVAANKEDLTVSIIAKSYYQPEKTLSITTKVIK